MLCWNAYIGDFNSGEIRVFNVFDHWSFYNACVKAKKKYKDDKQAFAEEVRGWLMYYFWSKCEYETVLTHWPDGEMYELRQEMDVGDLREAMRRIGIEMMDGNVYRIKDDTPVVLRCYRKSNRFRDKKIDVYEQVHNNWEPFIDYLWEHRNELKARK